MAEKKNPYFFTIGFNQKKEDHVRVAQILNQLGKGEKADYIARAILAYEGESLQAGEVDPADLRQIIRQILKEEYSEKQKEETVSKETVVDVSEYVEKDPELAKSVFVRGKVILQSQGKEFFTWHGKDFFT